MYGNIPFTFLPTKVMQKTLQKTLAKTAATNPMMTVAGSQIRAMADADVPAKLKKFIKDNTNLSPELLQQTYGSSSLDKIKEDLRLAKAFKYQTRRELIDKKSIWKKSVVGDKPFPKEEEQPYLELLSYIGNFITLLEQYSELRSFQDKDKKEDAAAVSRGFENAEQAQAIREVELEWYFKLYGTKDPVQVLAYQRTERKKYGTTSYEAALKGQQLVEIGSLDKEAITQEAEAEADEMKDEIAQAKASQKKRLLYIGIPVGLVVGYFLYRQFGRK